MGHLSDEMERDEEFYHLLVCTWIMQRRMDILDYINTSIQETGVESQILYFQIIGDEEIVEGLRGMRRRYEYY